MVKMLKFQVTDKHEGFVKKPKILSVFLQVL